MKKYEGYRKLMKAVLNLKQEVKVNLNEEILRIFDVYINRTLITREANIIDLRFGLTGVRCTLEEAGRIFNISRERVRQIEKKAVRKLLGKRTESNLLTVFFLNRSELIKKVMKFHEENERLKYEILKGVPEKTITNAKEMPIAAIKFSTRTLNCLERAKIEKIGQLIELRERELLNLRNLGVKTLGEIKEVLQKHNLKLKMDQLKLL